MYGGLSYVSLSPHTLSHVYRVGDWAWRNLGLHACPPAMFGWYILGSFNFHFKNNLSSEGQVPITKVRIIRFCDILISLGEGLAWVLVLVRILFYSILFYSILFYSILFYSKQLLERPWLHSDKVVESRYIFLPQLNHKALILSRKRSSQQPSSFIQPSSLLPHLLLSSWTCWAIAGSFRAISASSATKSYRNISLLGSLLLW